MSIRVGLRVTLFIGLTINPVASSATDICGDACQNFLQVLQETTIDSCSARYNVEAGFFLTNCERVLSGKIDNGVYNLEVGRSTSSENRLSFYLEDTTLVETRLIDASQVQFDFDKCRQEMGQECRVSPLFEKLLSDLDEIVTEESQIQIRFTSKSPVFSSQIEDVVFTIISGGEADIVIWTGGTLFSTNFAANQFEFFYLSRGRVIDGTD